MTNVASIYVLLAAYALLAALVLVQVVANLRTSRTHTAESDQGRSYRIWFHRLMLVAVLARFAALIVELKTKDDDKDSWTGYWTDLTHFLPSLLFFSTYSLLIVFWARLVHQTSSSSNSPFYLGSFYLLLNIAAYVTFVSAAIITGVKHKYHPFTNIVEYVLGVIDLSAAMGFLYYGFRVVQQISSRDSSFLSHTRSRIMCRVLTICVLCTLTFLARGLFAILVSTKKLESQYPDTHLSHYVWDLIIFSTTELVPTLVILLLTLVKDDEDASGVEYGEVYHEQPLFGDYPQAVVSRSLTDARLW